MVQMFDNATMDRLKWTTHTTLRQSDTRLLLHRRQHLRPHPLKQTCSHSHTRKIKNALATFVRGQIAKVIAGTHVEGHWEVDASSTVSESTPFSQHRSA